MNTNNFVPKNPKIFNCINCDYLTSKLKDYSKHCLTQKHKRLTNTNELSQNCPKNPKLYNCICGNVYKHMSSLCKHKKKCNFIQDENDNDNKDNEYMYQGINIKDKDALVIHLLKQN
jgi:hypothetical protein